MPIINENFFDPFLSVIDFSSYEEFILETCGFRRLFDFERFHAMFIVFQRKNKVILYSKHEIILYDEDITISIFKHYLRKNNNLIKTFLKKIFYN